MGWSIGYDSNWKRDVGYGVPATCDYPSCGEEIDRGLSYVCCEQEMFGGENGCGLYFCEKHLSYHEIEGEELHCCERCGKGEKPFEPTPDVPKWIEWKLTHESWNDWREENQVAVAAMRLSIQEVGK